MVPRNITFFSFKDLIFMEFYPSKGRKKEINAHGGFDVALLFLLNCLQHHVVQIRGPKYKLFFASLSLVSVFQKREMLCRLLRKLELSV